MIFPLISIIVPVYKVEKYLEKCINSIIAQTYRNLEIILVDDGSTDNCPAICDHFQTKDSRIKVIHQENGGLSHARNVGLEHATGDFIGFVDSDDWIEANMYEVLMSALQETGADIAVCDRQMERESSKSLPINVKSYKKTLYTPEESLKQMIKGEGIIKNTVWNKLYKRNTLLNIIFLERKIFEDLLWSPQVIGNSKLLICLDYPLYHYLQRVESLSHDERIIKKREQDKIEMIEQRTEYIRNYYSSLEKIAIIELNNFYFFEYIKYCLYYWLLDASGENRYELYKKFCRFDFTNITNYDKFYTTLCRILFRISPSFLAKIFILFHKIKIVLCKIL